MANIVEAISVLKEGVAELPEATRVRLTAATRDGMEGFRSHAKDWDELVSSDAGQDLIRKMAPHFGALILDAMTGALNWSALYAEFNKAFPETGPILRAAEADTKPIAIVPDGAPHVSV